jgi:hypothetical protein
MTSVMSGVPRMIRDGYSTRPPDTSPVSKPYMLAGLGPRPFREVCIPRPEYSYNSCNAPNSNNAPRVYTFPNPVI